MADEDAFVVIDVFKKIKSPINDISSLESNINKFEVHNMDDLTAEVDIESSFKLKLFTLRKTILYKIIYPQYVLFCLVEISLN